MEGVIDADSPLDYAEFHIVPTENRYEARVSLGSAVEVLTSGILGQLSPCLPELRVFSAKGSIVDFKLHPPKDLSDVKWFTKSTLKRFLCIIDSPDILNITNAIGYELSQLEDSRNFHLSLYAKGHEDQSGIEEVEDDDSNGSTPSLKAQGGTMSADASKNELLRAMELRISALREKLASTFNQAAGAMCSTQQINDLIRFSQFVGAEELRNSLNKLVEMNQRHQTVDFSGDDQPPTMHDSSKDRVNGTEGYPKISKSQSDPRVKYGVSPAKVAQVERQSSTESDESSFSSEEDQPSGERSRSLVRSASPRRSASPMRRVQVGRSGSRRATALTIKSLSYIPARDRMFQRDATASGSDEEGSEQPPRRPESNVQRISVQDAINLFERKQKDQIADIQKRRTSLDTSVNANKSVLRRWSAGMGDSSAQCLPETVSESPIDKEVDSLEGREIQKISVEVNSESDFTRAVHNSVEAEVGPTLDAFERGASYPVDTEVDDHVIQTEGGNDKVAASAEWTRQKEAELNQMLMKMMENKPVKNRNVPSTNGKSQSVPSKQRGGLYEHYKEKRDEKLRGETAGKRAEKEAQFKAMQQMLDKRKSEIASANVTDSGKRNSLGKPQKPNKSASQIPSLKKETSQPAAAKKTSTKASSLPAIRKSWPSTPSSRAAGISPAKTPGSTSSAGTTPTRRKPQTKPSVPLSNPKVERSQQRPANAKASQNASNMSIKGANEKKQQPASTTSKTGKTRLQSTSGDLSSAVPAKPTFYNRVTKKSSVVPVESKPFLRKGSGIGPGVGSAAAKTRVPSQPEESLTKSENLDQAQENEMVANGSDPVCQQQGTGPQSEERSAHLEAETHLSSSQNFDDVETSDQVTASGDDSFTKTGDYDLKPGSEEVSMISPTAWVEIEEHLDLPVPCEVASPVDVAPVAISSPRVRHSLSQMLLEESSEPDIVEWGNAENPPAMVYQKDAPKGLKRLLKFARKSRGDASSTGWSSPSAFSEAEDEAEDSKSLSKRSADNLLRKAALNATNYGQQKSASYEGHEKTLAIHEILSAHKSESHISTAATTTKGSRSFFSLSAFKGSKPNETKLR